MTILPGEAPQAPFTIDPGSFRDRTARVFHSGSAVYRGLTRSAWEEWQSVSASRFFRQALEGGQIVKTDLADPSTVEGLSLPTEWSGILRHETLRFISYPYEWCFGMLKDAALLQLELLAAALEEGIILKDATPFNVQWTGSTPIFIDVASFVRWRSGEPWAGYRQFCQLLLYPLFLQAYKGVPFQPWLRGRLEGIEAEECRRLMSWRDLFRPGVLTHVVAQSHLQRRFGATAPEVKRELKQVGFPKSIIAATVSRLRAVVNQLEWVPGTSTWSEYAATNSYDDESSAAKETFVDRIMEGHRGATVWDLGCNTGRFAKLAARHADYVIAVDSDHASIERLYRELKSSGPRNVLPLVGNIADLPSALGWRGMERRAFVDRGRPDVVLCLALVHHLAITSNIPIADLVRWLGEFGAEVVVEFPMPNDPMVQRLLLSRDQAYDDYNVACFESALTADFEVRDRLALPSGTRVLYHALPKTTADRLSRQASAVSAVDV